jgi:putative endopeptidase
MKRSLFLLAGVLCAALATVPAVASPMPKKPEIGQWGVDLSAMDKKVRPGNDFFKYVNGTWLKTAKIPADRTGTGSFLLLRIRSEKRLKTIVDRLAAKPYDQLTPEEKKLRDLYDAFTDEKQIEARGLAPFRPDLTYLQGLMTRAAVAQAFGKIRLQIDVPFNMAIGIDDKHPESYAIFLYQGGIGLPNRDYYTRKDKAIVKTRNAYKAYIAKMFTLAGLKHAKKRAAAVYALEKKIAAAQWANEDRRDPDKVYNPMTVAALKNFAPGFKWDAFFAAAGIPEKGPKGERVVIISEKSAFPKFAKIFAETPVATWRDYLTAHYMHSFAAYMPKAFDQADFDFYGKVVSGQKQQLDRATRGVHLLDNDIGEALGKLYVAKYFPPSAKAAAEKLVHNLLRAYEADIKTLPWMTPATRAKALEKLHKFTPHIGYPDKWRDYSALVIKRDDLLGDAQRSAMFEWNRQLKRIDEPVDKGEWGMTPPTVNAYYNPSLNEIVFPAAILQPPFFDPNADDAVNYGGIGAVIGHEISHGFDDQGSKYNGAGVLKNWWTEKDKKAFKARTDALVAQYSAYEPLPGVHVNGKFTLGENIADLAGLTIAYKAYHLSLGGQKAPVIDGYTGDQRFFLSFGQIWRGKYRTGRLRALTLSNPHSPPHFRADGVTRNLDAWYAAFDVKPGDKFYLAPDKRVRLW